MESISSNIVALPRKSLVWLECQVLGLGLGLVYQVFGLGLAGQVLVNITGGAQASRFPSFLRTWFKLYKVA